MKRLTEQHIECLMFEATLQTTSRQSCALCFWLPSASGMPTHRTPSLKPCRNHPPVPITPRIATTRLHGYTTFQQPTMITVTSDSDVVCSVQLSTHSHCRHQEKSESGRGMSMSPPVDGSEDFERVADVRIVSSTPTYVTLPSFLRRR